MTDVKTIGVIGAGTMGSGIAQAGAGAGLAVTLIDVSSERLQHAMKALSSSLERMLAKGKLAAADRDSMLARITSTTDYGALAACDYVIEAATENEALKIRILQQIDSVSPATTIVATNTSSISITKLAAATRRAERFVGLHFFNPVPVMALVEVVRGLQTSDATVDASVALARRLGKTPIVVRNAPGFVVNRLLVPMLNEAIFACAEGIASAKDIDEAMKLGCNHPIGPLALCDLIGLDVVLAVMEVLYHDFNDPKYRPAPLLKEMVAAGRLGRKSGRGFHSYG